VTAAGGPLSAAPAPEPAAGGGGGLWKAADATGLAAAAAVVEIRLLGAWRQLPVYRRGETVDWASCSRQGSDLGPY
jgi:hypothetical protein